MYKLNDIDAEYIEELVNDTENLHTESTTRSIIKGLEFLELKGPYIIGGAVGEIYVDVGAGLFCDADIIYLEQYGWICDPGSTQFAYLL